jgi:hypothetical protein
VKAFVTVSDRQRQRPTRRFNAITFVRKQDLVLHARRKARPTSGPRESLEKESVLRDAAKVDRT